MCLRSTDLPVPDGPMMALILPRGMSKVMSFSTVWEPKDLVRPLIEMMASSAGGPASFATGGSSGTVVSSRSSSAIVSPLELLLGLFPAEWVVAWPTYPRLTVPTGSSSSDYATCHKCVRSSSLCRSSPRCGSRHDDSCQLDSGCNILEMVSETTQHRILDAALSAMETHGVSRVSVGDIAKRADLSRQTLYRYFRVKGDLLAAVIERETGRIVDQIGAATATADPADPEDALTAALATAVRAAQEHAVLQRALETDREVLVGYLTGSPGVGEPTRPALARLLMSVFDELDQEDAERVADLAVRVVVSWILNPPPEPLERRRGRRGPGAGAGPRPHNRPPRAGALELAGTQAPCQQSPVRGSGQSPVRFCSARRSESSRSSSCSPEWST